MSRHQTASAFFTCIPIFKNIAMKILIYLLILVASSFSVTAQTNQKKASTETTFGRYNNCSSGRGACGITINVAENGKQLPNTYSKNMSEHSFILTINRSSLAREDEIRIAGKPFKDIRPEEQLQFLQEDILLVSKLSLQNLNLEISANKIYPGSYPMFLGKDKVEIIFTLRN